MIVLPNGKVCRNLPEQVAENMKNIEMIVKFLNESNVAAYLIELEALPAALNDSQKEIALRDLAIIKYDGDYYFKSEVAVGGVLIFAKLNLEVSEETSLEGIDFYAFKTEAIEVQMPSGSCALVSNQYNLANVDELSSKFALLTGANFSGPVKAKTLSQNEANYSFNFEVNVEDTINFEKVGTQYCKMEIVNGELHIIILAQFHNIDTANSRTTRLSQFNINNIPNEIASKIYGYNGNPISEGNAGIVRIAPIGVNAGAVTSLDAIRIQNSNPNSLTLYQPQGKTVPANESITFSMEVNLSLF